MGTRPPPVGRGRGRVGPLSVGVGLVHLHRAHLHTRAQLWLVRKMEQRKPPNATLVLVHAPKTGGSTLGAIFQTRRRLYQVVSMPRRVNATVRYVGGHKTVPQLQHRCEKTHQECLWLMSFRNPISRLQSAFSTSAEDHQHFDCPAGTRLHRRLRREPRLTLEEFTRYPTAERRACGLNIFLDQLVPRLSRPPRARTQAKRLRAAKAFVSELALVALTEHLPRSLLLLDATLGLHLRAFPSVFTFNPKQGGHGRGTANLTARAERVLRRDMRPDFVLWRAAQARFDVLWSRQFGGHPERARVRDPTPPFQCKWSAARCWDKLTTSHVGYTTSRIKTQRSTDDVPVQGLLRPETSQGEWSLLRPPQRGPGAPRPVETWAVHEVTSTRLWRYGSGKGRRQRVLCAAPCLRTNVSFELARGV